MKRIERLCSSEKIPEGSVVKRFVPSENVKGMKKEGTTTEWSGGK